MLRRTDSADDVADVIAETFLAAWRRLDDVPQGDSPCCGCTARPADPRTEAIRAAFAALDPADREVLAQASWEGLTGPQIATVLGCSSTAVRVRLHKARKRLARLLGTTDEAPVMTPLRGES